MVHMHSVSSNISVTEIDGSKQSHKEKNTTGQLQSSQQEINVALEKVLIWSEEKRSRFRREILHHVYKNCNPHAYRY